MFEYHTSSKTKPILFCFVLQNVPKQFLVSSHCKKICFLPFNSDEIETFLSIEIISFHRWRKIERKPSAWIGYVSEVNLASSYMLNQCSIIFDVHSKLNERYLLKKSYLCPLVYPIYELNIYFIFDFPEKSRFLVVFEWDITDVCYRVLTCFTRIDWFSLIFVSITFKISMLLNNRQMHTFSHFSDSNKWLYANDL